MRIGFGYDVHAYAAGRKLILGGVEIDYIQGLLGHSDADVLVHAIMDALLGSLALGDIGSHFPDTDPQYKNISSLVLLSHVGKLIKDRGYEIGNIDSEIVCQQPKLLPYIPKMRENIAKVLEIKVDQISVKATTEERLGFTGRLEGIRAYCNCLVKSQEEEADGEKA